MGFFVDWDGGMVVLVVEEDWVRDGKKNRDNYSKSSNGGNIVD